MPSYIIASNNEDDLGYIKDINLCPYFSTTYCTVQVQNISTLANFQILTADDTIESNHMAFLPPLGLPYLDPKSFFTLNLGEQQGISYDSLPNLINTYLRRAGQTFTCMLDTLHRTVFINRGDIFVITAMSYNFQTLLGYTGAMFPMYSHEKAMWVSKRSEETEQHHITGAGWIKGGYNPDIIQIWCPDRDTYCNFPVRVEPETFWNYRIEWEAIFDQGSPQFLTILTDTGTITLYKDASTGKKSCTIKARVYEGRTETPAVTITQAFEASSIQTPTTVPATGWG